MKIFRPQNRIQSKKKKSNFGSFLTSKRIVFAVSIIIFSLILFFFVRFVRSQVQELQNLSFSSPNQDGLRDDLHSVSYSSGDVFTLLIITEERVNDRDVIGGFILIRVDMTSHSAALMSIHPELAIPLQYVPGMPVTALNLTTAKIRDLSVIGDLQIEPVPLAYPFYQLQELFAVPIDGYVVFPPGVAENIGPLSGKDAPSTSVAGLKDYQEWGEAWEDYWSGYLRSLSVMKIWMNRGIVPEIESNMNVVDVYTFARDFASLPEESVETLVPPTDAVVKMIDERGEQVNGIQISAVDSMLEGLGRDNRMDREQARIEIFNGTDVDGWGGRYERWVKHLGGEVIRVKNAPQQRDGTVIYVTDQEEYAYTVSRISSLWENVELVEGRPDFITTGDIIVLLGVDF